MPSTYAKIQGDAVINIQMCSPTDYFDPSYTWVIVDGVLCTDGITPIQIGCTYDGTNFYAPQGN